MTGDAPWFEARRAESDDDGASLARVRAAFACARDGVAWPPTEPTEGALLLERAERELCRVHALELARAARRAITLRARGASAELTGAFQRRLRDALEAARRSGVRVPASLARTARDAPSNWPTDRELVHVAHALDPSGDDAHA